MIPTIIVRGKPVRVSDSFFALSPEEQSAAVRRITEQMARGVVTGMPRKNPRQPHVNTSAKADRSDPAAMAPAWRDGFGLYTPNETSNSEGKSDRELSRPGHFWSELPGNIGPSAVNTATGLWDVITHPQQTAETLVDAAQGGVDRVMPEEFTNFMDTYISPRSPETRDRQRQISGAVGQALKDRYWGLENLKNTLITDPVGSALDVIGIATGAAGAIRAPLSIGSKAGLVEAPATALKAGHPALKRLGQTIGDDDIVTPAINKADVSHGKVVSADGKRNKIYAPPTKPQRPFEADYTKGVKADEVDEAGNLLVDRHGKPFNPGDIVFGRRTLGGSDVGASHKDFRELIKRFMGKPIERVPRQHIDDSSGKVRYNEKTNTPYGVYIADDLDLSKSRNKHIVDHEGSHLMDILTGRAPMPPEVRKEAESVYSTLATGKENLPKLKLPSDPDRGYSGSKMRDEFAGEIIRAALKDPNYMKTVAPQAYDWAAELLAKLGIRLNSLGAATVSALLGTMGQENESKAAESPGERDSRSNFLLGTGSLPGQSAPFGPTDGATKEGTNGRAELVKALSRRGFPSQAPRNKKSRELVRALVDLETRQRSRLYGGPR